MYHKGTKVIVRISVGSTNMALHQSAYQSADADAVANHQPSAPRAVDGNRDTSWISGSCTALSGDGPGAPNWWVVDLAVPIHVDNVVVTNRGDCCRMYLLFIYLFICLFHTSTY